MVEEDIHKEPQRGIKHKYKHIQALAKKRQLCPKKVSAATNRCADRMKKYFAKTGKRSIYNINDKVFVRYRHRRRGKIPTKISVLRGKIIKIGIEQNTYKVELKPKRA